MVESVEQDTTSQAQAVVKSQSPIEFAKSWYTPLEIFQWLNGKGFSSLESLFRRNVPSDHHSIEFAEWLANELCLAMAKGIEIGKRTVEEKSI